MIHTQNSIFQRPPERKQEIKKKRWKILPIIWKAFTRMLMVLGGIVFLTSLLGTFTFFSAMNKAAPPLPEQMVLVLKLEEGIAEVSRSASFSDLIPEQQPTIRRIVEVLDRAKDDNRIKGLVFNIKSGAISITHIQELRAAIKRFKQSGKFTKIYSSSYADYSQGLGLYYLASAFEEIWIQPVGLLSVAGINIELPFMRDLLDKVGAQPQFLQREDYKSAMENFTRRGISPKNKEMLNSIVQNLSTIMANDIAKDRDISKAALKNMINQGLLTGKEALEGGLIDRIDYGDVLVSEMRKEITGDPDSEDLELVSLSRYASNMKDNIDAAQALTGASNKSSVAVVYVVGTIMPTGKSDNVAAADTIASAFQDAIDNNSIEAIIVRVDSPGGSPTASETIRRSIIRAKEKGKKVIVSMGATAASGGYWLAADADHIFALPGTLTGSIGVIFGKFELSSLWQKLGLNWHSIRWGENAGLLSPNEGFDEKGLARLNILIDHIYDSFLERVSAGRGIEIEKLRKIARGRAWTGDQAIRIGLVDSLGGLDDTLDYTAIALGKKNRDDLKITILPKPESPVEKILKLFGQQVELGQFFEQNSKVLDSLDRLLSKIDVAQNPEIYTVYESDLEAFR